MFGGIASIASRAPWRRSARRAEAPTPDAHEPGTVYQVGTMDALRAGAYVGTATVGELLDQGDLGLGLLDHLDGGLVIVDGLAYRLRGDGAAEPVGAAERTAFAMALPFRPTATRALDWTEGCDVQRLVDRMAKGTGLIQAVRIDGTFRRVRVRTVSRQEPPFRPYTEVTEAAPEATWQDVSGTLVGFRTPASLEGLSGAGFSFHFIADDRRTGGHVLDFTVGSGELALHPGMGLRLAVLPQTRSESVQAA